MQVNAISRATMDTIETSLPPFMIDPLDHDDADDEVVVTTMRGLIRLALVAADTAARFEREAVGHDPVAWMIAPRALFGGAWRSRRAWRARTAFGRYCCTDSRSVSTPTP